MNKILQLLMIATLFSMNVSSDTEVVPKRVFRVERPSLVSRARYVNLTPNVFFNPAPLQPGEKINLIFFGNARYIGVIDEIQVNGPENYIWIGHLEGVEYSSLFIVYIDGVFIGHAASPEGVYEWSSVGNGIYRIVKINQPAGE